MDKIIKSIARILNIKKPTLKIDNSKLKTSTQMGALYINDNKKAVIYLKSGLSDNDKVFVVAHELRHYYQIINGLVTDDYTTVGDVDSKSYNEQDLEIDANAFAKIIMVNYRKVEPLFNGLDEFTKMRINARVEEIIEELQQK